MASERIALEDLSVAIGMPTYGNVHPKTVKSIAATITKCVSMGVRCDLIMETSSVVQIARDNVLDDFLQTDVQKLFWIDSDMVWDAEDFLTFLALSKKREVVGAAYPAKVEGQPTYFMKYQEGIKSEQYDLIEVEGLGLGFTIMDREVVMRLAGKAPRVNDKIAKRTTAAVFRIDTLNGDRRTEDMAFFADIRDLGYKVWMYPHIELGHIGQREWRGSVKEALVKLDG